MAVNASYANWSPYERYVQQGGSTPGMSDGHFLNGATVGIFAGPPRLSTVGSAVALGAALTNPAAASEIVYPVGITQNFNLSQNRQFSRIFELGSERSYFISGRTIGQVGLSRVLYHGPSILRVLYAYYADALPPTLVPSVFDNPASGLQPNPHDVVVPPGYANFFINLASDLFTQPIGLLVVIKDTNLDTYGAFYLEACNIPNITTATDSQGVIIQESAAIQYELLVPISTTTIELIA